MFSLPGKPFSIVNFIPSHTCYISLTRCFEVSKTQDYLRGSVYFELLVFLEHLAYSRWGLVSGKNVLL